MEKEKKNRNFKLNIFCTHNTKYIKDNDLKQCYGSVSYKGFLAVIFKAGCLVRLLTYQKKKKKKMLSGL